jgi:hypothetical protein
MQPKLRRRFRVPASLIQTKFGIYVLNANFAMEPQRAYVERQIGTIRLVGSSTGAVARRLILGVYPGFSPFVPVYDWPWPCFQGPTLPGGADRGISVPSCCLYTTAG